MSRSNKRRTKNRLPDNGISFVKNDAAFHPGEIGSESDDDKELQAERPSREELREHGAIELKPEYIHPPTQKVSGQ